MDDQKDSATPIIGANPNDSMTLEQRSQAFNDELRQLLGKYELALTAEAFVRNGQVLAAPKIVDQRELKKVAEEMPEAVA